MKLIQLSVLLLFITVSIPVCAAPTRVSVSARAGARVIAALHRLETPQLPGRMDLSSQDRLRGYALLDLKGRALPLEIRAGHRDEGRLGPPSKGLVKVLVNDGPQEIEMVRHME